MRVEDELDRKLAVRGEEFVQQIMKIWAVCISRSRPGSI